MKRNEKIRAKEIEMQKQAAAKTNAQVIFTRFSTRTFVVICCQSISTVFIQASGWAGLVRGKNSQPPFNVQPVSPVVTTKKAPGAIKKPVAQAVQQAKPVQVKQQKVFLQKRISILIPPIQPKEELFWDSAVDAVITDKANVKNPSAKVNSGTSDAEKVNTNGNEKVDKVVNNQV